MQITYSTHPTPFGHCLLAQHQQQICWLSLYDQQPTSAEISALLNQNFPNYDYQPDPVTINPLIIQLCQQPQQLTNFPVQLTGTPFQKQVWQQLRQLPAGSTISYSALAQQLGQPKAARAVARAVAQNKIALLVPCHRVIKKSGAPHQYRWGSARKQQLLAWEQAN